MQSASRMVESTQVERHTIVLDDCAIRGHVAAELDGVSGTLPRFHNAESDPSGTRLSVQLGPDWKWVVPLEIERSQLQEPVVEGDAKFVWTESKAQTWIPLSTIDELFVILKPFGPPSPNR